MAVLPNAFKDIFLAGVGAMAMTGEKAQSVVDDLIAKGELTVEQGKELNKELQHKATDATAKVRDEALAAQIKAMTPEQRADFLASVTKIVDEAAAAPEAADAPAAE